MLETEPSAVELIDHHVIDLASTVYPELRIMVPAGVKAVLLVKFDGQNQGEVDQRLKRLDLMKRNNLVLRTRFAYTPAETEKFWALRKKSLPYVMKIRRDGRRPTPFIEDVVVKPERLASFIHDLSDIYRRYGIEGVTYGHAGDGQLHTRPLLDLKEETDIHLITKIADEVFGLVAEYGGSITGEHGNGLVRSRYVKRIFGKEVYQVFRQI